MKFFISFGLCLIFSFAMLSDVAKAEQILLLNLQYKSDKTTTKEIHFYGSDIDPNSVSIDDRFSLTIDGKSVQLPEQLYRRLDWLRRSFSYDSLSGGIQQPKKGESICLLGGSAAQEDARAVVEILNTPSQCTDLDCVTTVQDGNCTVVTYYWRGRVINTRRYCPVDNGNSDISSNGNGENEISINPCSVCDRPNNTDAD